jgi:hypothetical protein
MEAIHTVAGSSKAQHLSSNKAQHTSSNIKVADMTLM